MKKIFLLLFFIIHNSHSCLSNEELNLYLSKSTEEIDRNNILTRSIYLSCMGDDIKSNILEICKKLIEKGANPNQIYQDGEGSCKSPLTAAIFRVFDARYRIDFYFKQMLSENQIQEAEMDYLQNFLECALHKGCIFISIVKLLLENGAKIDLVIKKNDGKFYTPYALAQQYKLEDIVELFDKL